MVSVKGMWKQYLLMSFLAAFAILFMLEGVSQIYVYSLESRDDDRESMYVFDRALGWRLKDGAYKHRDFDAPYTVLNGRRVTVPGPGGGCAEVNIYGDSFAFGIGVDDASTIASLLSREMDNHCVNNHGVLGYGPLQYFMKRGENSREGSVDVFLIFTGNDYRDIQRERMDWGPMKPVLVPQGNGYVVEYPAGEDFKVELGKFKLRFRSPDVIRRIAKGIPFIVRLRNRLASPDYRFVHEAMKRFDYLLRAADKKRTVFVIVPSISLTLGISENTSEGYFAGNLEKYLRENNYLFINIHEERLLTESDYWKQEGHLNAEGNGKVAKAVAEFLRAEGRVYSVKGDDS